MKGGDTSRGHSQNACEEAAEVVQARGEPGHEAPLRLALLRVLCMTHHAQQKTTQAEQRGERQKLRTQVGRGGGPTSARRPPPIMATEKERGACAAARRPVPAPPPRPLPRVGAHACIMVRRERALSGPSHAGAKPRPALGSPGSPCFSWAFVFPDPGLGEREGNGSDRVMERESESERKREKEKRVVWGGGGSGVHRSLL